MTSEKKPKYYLDSEGRFVIENYNYAKPFANFFPGIAGKYGIPMWVFYVNRGQGIVSFGTRNKSGSILEFIPANKAWEQASLQGFRTFIKLKRKGNPVIYEPFHNGFVNLSFKLENRMLISSEGLTIEEDNLSLGLYVKIEYFNIPNDTYAGLARIVTIKNSGKISRQLEVLDGLPKIIPYGASNLFIKNLSRTIEAWMKVENLEKSVPFFKLSVEPVDRPEVIHIKEGNFYAGFLPQKNGYKLIKPIVDPESIFGPATDFSCPLNFLSAKEFVYPREQQTTSKTPSAFSMFKLKLKGGASQKFYSVTGYMRSIERLNAEIKRVLSQDYITKKQKENRTIIEALQKDISTLSSSPEFNLYAKQTYLDNILRGGYPVIFGQGAGKKVFYLYSRKHGDLERDYNKFLLQPTYFSQGNGNYRDMNQNRRCDIWFNPLIQEENLIYFFNLIQTDGFNPLVIKGTSFLYKNSAQAESGLEKLVEKNKIPFLKEFLKEPFTPGSLIFFVEENRIKLKVSYDDFLNNLISGSSKIQEAEHGEGFWSDHWAYCLDLLENYLAVYPDKLKQIIFENRRFTYFDNTETVRPRSEKYLLYHGLPRQLHAVVSDKEKNEIISKRQRQPNVVRRNFGSGDIYYTSLINKLLCLTVNKMASLDPFGVGIEMEANKPNWYDALNGLPALFGSSSCETFELKRLINFILNTLQKSCVEKISVTKEMLDFLYGIGECVKEYFPGRNNFFYWDKGYSLKEDFRKKTKLGLSGEEEEISSLDLKAILESFLRKLKLSLETAYNKTKKNHCAYFINEVVEYDRLNHPYINPRKFKQVRLPLFLESQMHALRLAETKTTAKSIYTATKASVLFDKKLKMYKVTENLKSMPEEIGRCRVFSPGWLEHESIWLHMEYKYLLEILKQGLYKEFYEEFKNILIPFQNPQRYGRSILENSSFIVSSAFKDKRLHGNGFVARLSGSTAEFLEIWLKMNTGKQPFFLNQKNELCLSFRPALAGWLFDKNGLYTFNFLSKITLTYHNPKRKDTFGDNAPKCERAVLTDTGGKNREIISDIIPPPYAEQIRSGQFKKIDIFLN